MSLLESLAAAGRPGASANARWAGARRPVPSALASDARDGGAPRSAPQSSGRFIPFAFFLPEGVRFVWSFREWDGSCRAWGTRVRVSVEEVEADIELVRSRIAGGARLTARQIDKAWWPLLLDELHGCLLVGDRSFRRIDSALYEGDVLHSLLASASVSRSLRVDPRRKLPIPPIAGLSWNALDDDNVRATGFADITTDDADTGDADTGDDDGEQAR